MDVNLQNKIAWDNLVQDENRWTIPVTESVIQKAKDGIIELYLTPTKIVPQNWYPDLKNKKVLCLASGGGQQGPVFSAAGSEVTVLDISDKQLEQDQKTAKRYDLNLTTVKQSMDDLSCTLPAAVSDLFPNLTNKVTIKRHIIFLSLTEKRRRYLYANRIWYLLRSKKSSLWYTNHLLSSRFQSVLDRKIQIPTLSSLPV